MAERRALIEGLSEEDRDREAEFVYKQKPHTSAAKPAAPAPQAPPVEAAEPLAPEPPAPPALPQSLVEASQVSNSSHLAGVGRVSVGVRVRTELAAALKRTSLQRQLNGIEPFALQEIFEEALELWLVKNGQALK